MTPLKEKENFKKSWKRVQAIFVAGFVGTGN